MSVHPSCTFVFHILLPLEVLSSNCVIMGPVDAVYALLVLSWFLLRMGVMSPCSKIARLRLHFSLCINDF